MARLELTTRSLSGVRFSPHPMLGLSLGGRRPRVRSTVLVSAEVHVEEFMTALGLWVLVNK